MACCFLSSSVVDSQLKNSGFYQVRRMNFHFLSSSGYCCVFESIGHNAECTRSGGWLAPDPDGGETGREATGKVWNLFQEVGSLSCAKMWARVSISSDLKHEKLASSCLVMLCALFCFVLLGRGRERKSVS